MSDDSYLEFLKAKQIRPRFSGFETKEDNPKLFPWQSDVCRWATKKGRCAIFAECGLGKTPMQLQWAKEVHTHTNLPVLIVAPLAVAAQTKREGEKFGVPVKICRTKEDVENGVNITNYEMLEHFDASAFSGVVLDESSILKAYTGKMKRMIVKMFQSVEYRLCATATPAPNDLMELLNHAEFLGIMRSNEALSCWFIADQSNSGHYRLKGHAAKDFWRWVSSWAVCISAPSDLGYSDEGFVLPLLTENDVILKTEDDSLSDVGREICLSATGFHKEKRRTLSQRCAKVAELANDADEQVLIWCYQNDEADELRRLLPNATEVRGSDKPERKENAALAFATGNDAVLISKPSIFGFGLNFQRCHRAIFCGLDYSYESYYQAVRRLYRFGQKDPVRIDRVLSETEQHILDVINQKAKLKRDMGESMAAAMRDYQTEEVRGRSFKLSFEPQIATIPVWLKSAV